jgi:hypothetical protein
MSTLCILGGWGEGRTRSFATPHPWLAFLVQASDTNHVVPYLTQSCQRDIQRIAKLPDDWDGAGSQRPRPESVANALARLPALCNMAMVAGEWEPPHVSASESGDVTFEWWEGERKLTLYFGDKLIEALRVWGTDIESEMDSITVSRIEQLATAWAWLNGN